MPYCRYKCHRYKTRYACFACRKAFKPVDWLDLPHEVRRIVEPRHDFKCPDCGQPMRHVGMEFKAPPKDDVRKWKLAERLSYDHFWYHSCGCYTQGLRPLNHAELEPFLKEKLPRTATEKLLQNFDDRDADRKRNSRKRSRKLAKKVSGRTWGIVRPPAPSDRKMREGFERLPPGVKEVKRRQSAN